ncbi:MAG: hypothetical protein FJX67_18840 [Alphaproteobacteria bacterium]|nr:hypothetical protein [Alphaproteobacteria bacterium]
MIALWLAAMASQGSAQPVPSPDGPAKPDASEPTPGRYLAEREFEVPHYRLRRAYDYYVGRNFVDRDESIARDELLLFLIRVSDDGLRKNRDHIIAAGWRRSFLAEFDLTAAFVAELKAGHPARVYALHRRYKDLSHPRYQSLSFSIRSLAFRLGSLEAEFDSVIELLDTPSPAGRPRSGVRLISLAWRGYLPAIAELIARHRTGRALRRDDARAYYWALIGRDWGLDTSAEIAALEHTLSPDQIHWAREMLQTGSLVDLLLGAHQAPKN